MHPTQLPTHVIDRIVFRRGRLHGFEFSYIASRRVRPQLAEADIGPKEATSRYDPGCQQLDPELT